MTTRWVSWKERLVFTHKNKNTVCVAIPALGHLLVMLLRYFIVHRKQWSRAVDKFGIGLILNVQNIMVHLRGVYEGKREGDLGVTVATSLLPVL
jgi:hypothetical protein